MVQWTTQTMMAWANPPPLPYGSPTEPLAGPGLKCQDDIG